MILHELGQHIRPFSPHSWEEALCDPCSSSKLRDSGRATLPAPDRGRVTMPMLPREGGLDGGLDDGRDENGVESSSPPMSVGAYVACELALCGRLILGGGGFSSCFSGTLQRRNLLD